MELGSSRLFPKGCVCPAMGTKIPNSDACPDTAHVPKLYCGPVSAPSASAVWSLSYLRLSAAETAPISPRGTRTFRAPPRRAALTTSKDKPSAMTSHGDAQSAETEIALH